MLSDNEERRPHPHRQEGTMRTLLTVASVLVLALVAHAKDREYKPRRVVKPYPAITDPDFLPASRVLAEVTSAELVLGVVLDGQARAYPINMLTGPQREIINDTLAKTAIAATW